MADHLIEGEDYEVLPNGVVDLNSGALEKLHEMSVAMPTEAEADEEMAEILAMFGMNLADLDDPE